MKASDVQKYADKLKALGQRMQTHNVYSNHFEQLTEIADRICRNLPGGNGRYRYAKAVQMAKPWCNPGYGTEI